MVWRVFAGTRCIGIAQFHAMGKFNWIQFIDNDVILKLLEVFKVSIIFFLSLTPNSITSYTCVPYPPDLYTLGFISGPARDIQYLSYWRLAGVNLTSSQYDTIRALTNLRRFGENGMYRYLSLLTILEVATLFYVFITQKTLLERAVFNIVLETIIGVAWSLLEIFAVINVVPSPIHV